MAAPSSGNWVLPETKNYVRNARGQRLHFRYFYDVPVEQRNGDPASATPFRCVLFTQHGLTAHGNVQVLQKFAEIMGRAGYLVCVCDFHGHGYSEGEERCLVHDGEHLDDDLFTFVRLMSDPSVEEGDRPEHAFEGPMADARVRSAVRSLPFVLSGGSLGGCAALRGGLRLRSFAAGAAPAGLAGRFRGCVLLSPAVIAHLPPAPVLWILRNAVAPLVPAAELPACVDSATNDEFIWVDEAVMAANQEDPLRYQGRMRYATGVALVDWLADTQRRIGDVDFPFLLLHAPEDEILPLRGSRELYEGCATPDAWKSFIECPGRRHDLLSNDVPLVARESIAFMDRLLAARGGRDGTEGRKADGASS